MREAPSRGAVAAVANLIGQTAVVAALGFSAPSPAGAQGATQGTRDVFVDRAAETGLNFVHFNGMSGEFYFAETAGSGGALFDYDNDGDLDVYLVQAHMLGPGKSSEDALLPPVGELRDRLFRNDLSVGADGSPILRFTEVTEESGIRAEGYGMGAATGDFDNDGWVDLYVTNFGSNQLWRNNGDGTFSDVTAKSGADDIRWSVPATWLDFDRDGWLDLFVGNYVDFTIGSHKLCRTIAGAPDYCGPLAFNPLPDRLLRNRRDGGFEDRSASAGIDQEFGGALGAVAADLDGDGWPDLYVGNDGTPNQMWVNRKDGTFRNQALIAGTAVNMVGEPEASMGVSIADFDADGDEDIFLTHLIRETNTVYVNDGGGLFEDATSETGLGSPSWLYTGFGTAWIDFDNDGWLDLVVANGAVEVVEELAAKRDPYPLHQPNQLYRNEGARFVDVSASAG
ncbi:MAG: VCBS repeat-containing protein, partial [Acidobacteriota bacterium]|nr:VCBS repeat-containing protein [Acidobacteriota bacterium]